MWQLIDTLTEEKKTRRLYRNTQTGNEFYTYLLHTDQQKNKWWTFEDLYAMPFIRNMAATKIVQLYGNSLQLDDILGYLRAERVLLRSNDPEKIDKQISKSYELENLATTMLDPVRQSVGLCTLFILLNDERPDSYIMSEQTVKMSILSVDIDLQSFFFNWWTGIIERYGPASNMLSQIALKIRTA